MATILVVAEVQDGSWRPANNDVLTAAQKLAGDTGHTVNALLIGNGLDGFAEEAARYGAEKVIMVSDEKLNKFSPDVYAAAVAGAVRESAAAVVLMGATFTGKDVMSRVSQILDCGLAQDALSYRMDGDRILFTRPMYAGKLLAEVSVSSSPVLATFRPKSFKPEEKPVAVATESLSLDLPAPLSVVESIDASGGDKLDVTEADIIVSGGRGLRGPENWGILEELADVLNAATGCSRPVSDEGWRPHEEHLGQTGKTVSPELYIACGISGAIQHLAGISSSKFILAINKDEEAPIFKAADYGIVGDLFEVLPALTEEIKKLKSS